MPQEPEMGNLRSRICRLRSQRTGPHQTLYHQTLKKQTLKHQSAWLLQVTNLLAPTAISQSKANP